MHTADSIAGLLAQRVKTDQLDVQDNWHGAGEALCTDGHGVMHDLGNLRVTVAHRVFAPDDITIGVIAVRLGHLQRGRNPHVDLRYVDLAQDCTGQNGLGLAFTSRHSAHAAGLGGFRRCGGFGCGEVDGICGWRHKRGLAGHNI